MPNDLNAVCRFKTQNPLFTVNEHAPDMLSDILSDRGFAVAHSAEERLVPERVDMATGTIHNKIETVHKFR